MTTLQILGAMLVGGMVFGWPLALLMQRLVLNDTAYPEPRTERSPYCLHPRGWLEVVGIEPNVGSYPLLAVRLRCRMCGDDVCLRPIPPHQGRGDSCRDGADVLPFVHAAKDAASAHAPHATRAV